MYLPQIFKGKLRMLILSEVFQDSALESTYYAFPGAFLMLLVEAEKCPVPGPLFHALCRVSSNEVGM